MRSLKKSDFAGLVRYLGDAQSKTERVGYLSTANCHSNDIESAVLEVLNTQAINTRSEADKTYHLIVSFRSGEQPDKDTLMAIERRICEGLGYADHQRVSAVHTDTDNLHIHIAINKIHPTRYTIHTPYNDHKTLGQLCAKLEREYGLESDNHEPKRSGAAGRAADMERHSGVESLIGWINRECVDQLRKADSWHQFHETLQAHGLDMKERGRGLVVVAEEGTLIKASSIGRDFSRSNLEKRFGAYQESAINGASQSKKRYAKKPMRARVDTVELYARYRREQQTVQTERAVIVKRLIAEKDRAIESAKRIARVKRNGMKLVKGERDAKRSFYSLTSQSLKSQIDEIRAEYARARQALQEQHRRHTWADWLREKAEHGDREALTALRARDDARSLSGNVITGRGETLKTAGYKPDSITKKGTVIYASATTVVRDDGDKLKVTRGQGARGLEVALKLASQRYGRRVHVNGTDAFKERIVQAAASSGLAIEFDDAALERRRQALIQHQTKAKGNNHARQRLTGSGSSAGSTGSSRTGKRHGLPGARVTSSQPHLGGNNRGPATTHSNRLRRMSELGVVQLGNGGQMLLPRDVPHHVGNQRPASHDQLRRDLHRSGRGLGPPPTARAEQLSRQGRLAQLGTVQLDSARRKIPDRASQPQEITHQHLLKKTPIPALGQRPPKHRKRGLRSLSAVPMLPVHSESKTPIRQSAPPKQPAKSEQTRRTITTETSRRPVDAAKRYIEERESKRAKGFDIQKHSLYTAAGERAFIFAGLREIDGQSLALLSDGGAVQVMPIDIATANRLKRVKIGATITADNGLIRTKGRSR